jgi:hypothetical protein
MAGGQEGPRYPALGGASATRSQISHCGLSVMGGPALPANVITVTPYTVFKRVQAPWAVLNDAHLCEVVDDLR